VGSASVEAFPISDKVPDPHSVGAICNQNLGVFTVTEIAMENTGAIPPAHPLPGTPKAEYPGLQRCRTSVPLTCLARVAAWQSLLYRTSCRLTENPTALAFTDRDQLS
jgi:hypothetical protein